MRVPIEWLKELVDFSLSTEELGLKLTMIGLEVEGVEEMNGDTVLEVNVTPNRPDCLSILGIAREVSALLNAPLKFPEWSVGGEADACAVVVEIADEDLCHRYAGRDIRGVTIKESPGWMRKRLEKCGMRPINNVVDITNYVLLEMGHPLHAFDMDKLRGKKIRVERAGPGQKIKTLDGTDRSLPDDALLIEDAEGPLAVAGIMGGSESEVKETTRNIFLESAYFVPSSVRRTSKALGLKTESAYRFERGTDIQFLDKALDRAASLMATHAGGRVSKKVDVYPRRFQETRIEVRYGQVNKILGVSVSHDEMVMIVTRLGMKAGQDTTFFTVSPPSFRNDIQREIDVIEEIARFYGYNRIPVTVPKIPVSQETRELRYDRISAVKESLRSSGFSEAINYSFMSYEVFDVLKIGERDRRRKALALRNPINAGESHLRTTLVPSLLQNLIYNFSMGARDVKLFELSRVFIDTGGPLPEEEHHLGAVYFHERTPSLWQEGAPDFYVVKGAIEAFLDKLRTGDRSFSPTREPFLHPGKSCDILVSGEKIGFLGVMHPDILEKFSSKASRSEALVFEINLDRLLSLVPRAVKYVPIPRYPRIDRDIALIVDDSLPAAAVMEQLKSYPTDLIEEISIFDFYKGKNIPEGKKSLAFTLRYRAKERTLTDSEIEELHANLVNYITEKTGGTVRGAMFSP